MPAAPKKTPGPFSRAISAEIRALLGRRHFNQRQLADATGLSPNYVSKCLTDKQPFNTADLESIAEVLGTTPERLIQAAINTLSEDVPK